MSMPLDLLYSSTHEWVKLLDGGGALIGLTDYAERSLGDIVFVNLCAAGESFSAGESLGDVESIKAVSEIISPVSGTVLRVNENVLEKPESINENPYDAWLVEMVSVSDKESLIGANEYEELITP